MAQNFGQANIYTHNFIGFVGLDLYAILIGLTFIISLKLVVSCYKHKDNWLIRQVKAYAKNLHWNVFSFRCLMEIYFQIFFAAFINSYNLSGSSFGDVLNSILTIITLLFCFNLPLFIFIKVTNMQEREILEIKEFKTRFGVFYDGLST